MIKNKFRSTLFYILLSYALVFISHKSFGQTSYQLFDEEEEIDLKDVGGEALIKSTYTKIGWSSGANIPVDNTIGYYDINGWGLISLKGQVITKDLYYTLEAHQDVIIASIKDRFSNRLLYGTINPKGETLVPFKYTEIKTMNGQLVLSEKRNHQLYQGLFSYSHEQILPIDAYHIDHFSDDFFVYVDSLGNEGLVSTNGSFKIQPYLDSISPCHQGYAKIFKAGKTGLIDSLGNLLYKPTYKSIENLNILSFDLFEIRNQYNRVIHEINGDSVEVIDDEYMAVYRNGFAEILNKQYEVEYSGYSIDQIRTFKWYIIIRQSGQYVILKKNGELLEKYSFDSLQTDDSYLYAQRKNKWYIYDINSNRISDRSYEQVITHSDGLIPVKNNGYWGYIDSNGELSITLKYDSVSAFQDQLAQVDYVGFKSLINQSGETVGAISYDSIFINNNTAVVKSGSRTDIIDPMGQTLFQTYNRLKVKGQYYLEETSDGTQGLITRNGEIIFDPEMNWISTLYDAKYFVLKRNEEYAVSKLNGFLVIPFSSTYDQITHVSDEYIGVELNQKYGFVNKYNQLVIANRYDSVGNFNEGLCPVQVNGHWGYINQKENLIIQPNLDQISPFKNGSAIVQRDGLFGIIGSSGDAFVPIAYELIKRTVNGNFITKKNSKYAFFDSQGNKVLGSSYDAIRETKQGSIIVKRRAKYGVINSEGVYEIPLKYDEIFERANGLYICRYHK